jgi:hypothetical protein
MGHRDSSRLYRRSFPFPDQHVLRGSRRFQLPHGQVSGNCHHLPRCSICNHCDRCGSLRPSLHPHPPASDAILGLVVAVRCDDFRLDHCGNSDQQAASVCIGGVNHSALGALGQNPLNKCDPSLTHRAAKPRGSDHHRMTPDKSACGSELPMNAATIHKTARSGDWETLGDFARPSILIAQSRRFAVRFTWGKPSMNAFISRSTSASCERKM